MNTTISKINREITGIQLRPYASKGLWLGCVLPLALLTSVLKHPTESSPLFKLCTFFSLGLLLSSTVFVLRFNKKKKIEKDVISYYTTGFFMTLLFHLFFQKGIFFCWLSGFASSILFYKTFLFVLRHFPRCFTFGEALMVTQAFCLYLYSSSISILQAITDTPKTTVQISTLIIQIGIAAVTLICFITYRYHSFRQALPFYSMSAFVIIVILLLPLHILLRSSPILWIINMLTSDIQTVTVVLYWAFCSSIAVLAVTRQIQGARKASTTVRKTFHVLAVAVYLPGLYYKCGLLYLATGVVFGIFVALELLRISNMPPLGIFLQDGFSVFSDEKDIGAVALTPIYLLTGCSLPLWIHPAPCDLTDSAGFNMLPLLSGLLSIGVGDTAASYVGTWIGRHRWPGTKKTVEGTVGCVFSQLIVVYILTYFGLICHHPSDVIKAVIAIVITSLVEARTNQVDNLVLPLVMYIILA